MTHTSGLGLRPRRLPDLLDLPYRVYRGRIGFYAGLGVAMAIAQQAFAFAWQWWVFGALGAEAVEADPAAALGTMMIAFPVVVVLNAALVAIFTLPMIAAVRDTMVGVARPAGVLVRDAWSRAVPAAVCAVLFAAIWMIGLFLCILPGVFIGVALSLSTSLTYLERLGPFRAMGRSWNLVFGLGKVEFSTEANWVRVLLTGIVTIVVWYALSLLASLPVLFAQWVALWNGGQMVMTPIGPQPMPLPYMVPLFLVGAVLSGVFLPLAVTPWPILYLDIRTRHEGLDLELALERLEHDETFA
jgi:hypothetical protein